MFEGTRNPPEVYRALSLGREGGLRGAEVHEMVLAEELDVVGKRSTVKVVFSAAAPKEWGRLQQMHGSSSGGRWGHNGSGSGGAGAPSDHSLGQGSIYRALILS